jgi:hypothetical protein
LRIIAAAAVILGAACAHAAPVYGDANGDGAVDYRDAVVLLQAAAGFTPVDDTMRRNGDVAPVNDYNGGSFGDGRITILDALRVARRAGGLSTAAWPAKSTGMLLENGNSYTVRKYDATGAATTGPGTGLPDESNVITGPISETVGGVTYNNVYEVTASDGAVQHLLQVTDATDTPASVQATQLVLGGNVTSFSPPLIVAKYPLQNGTTWSGTTTATSPAAPSPVTVSYNASVSGPVSVTIADGVHIFDNAYKVTLNYSSFPLLSGKDYYWYVPFLGPVQHGYTLTTLLTTTKTINPDVKLVSANVHGVLYP